MTSVEPLHARLCARVREWRAGGYACEWRALPEILRWAAGEEPENPRYLRSAQVLALETYWYLRSVMRTPHVAALYRELYPDSEELAAALHLPRDLGHLAIDQLDSDD